MKFLKSYFYYFSLLRRAFSGVKWKIFLLAVFGVLNGLLEGIGINILIPIFSVVTKSSFEQDFITESVAKGFAFFNLEMDLISLLILISILFLGKAVVLIICNYISIKITADYELSTRDALFRKTISADWAYLLQQKLGYLENVLVNDVKYAAILLQSMSGGIITLTSLFIYIIIAVNLSLPITVLTLVIGGLFFLCIRPLIRKIRQVARDSAHMNKQVAHHINQHVTGMKSIKALQVVEPIIEKSKKYFQSMRNLKVRMFMLNHMGGAFIQPLSIIFICLIFAFTFNKPNFNFIALIAIIYLIQKIFLYIAQMQTTGQKIIESFPYLESVLNYQNKAEKNEEKTAETLPFTFQKDLCFENVGFSYTKNKQILENISFCIEKGQIVALIGPSGSGKTTIADLMLRLFRPKTGKIMLDGKNIYEILIEDWRKNVGYVSQDIFLINDTIANNIRFYGEGISDADIRQAARDAAAEEFILEYPTGLETFVGEKGVLLSGGQRQRIAIARILVRKPALLILDEATSSLDNNSELKIQKVIENLKNKVTVFVIAHRLSTIMNCDKVCVIENGKILESGSPQELLQRTDSYFYKMYNIRNESTENI